MKISVLVLHGPNLAAKARDEINPRLQEKADELEIALTFVQKNGEEGLLDALHAHADEVDAVLVNLGVLAPRAEAFAEGLALVDLPAVQLGNGQSSLTRVEQIDDGLKALERLVALVPAGSAKGTRKQSAVPSSAPVPRGKTIGRKAQAPEGAPEAPSRGKTIGRVRAEEKIETPPASGSLTRVQVRERIQARLQQKESAEALAHWARERWTSLQHGAPCEPGAKDVIENVLLTLMAGAKVSDAILVAQMAKLDS